MYQVIAIDPGQNNGWARYIESELVEYGTLQWEAEFCDWLLEQTPSVFVYEKYYIDLKRYNHARSEVVPVQAIGAIKLRARQVGCPVIGQMENIKPAAYGHMGAEYKKGRKDMHHMDAIAHGHEFLIKQGLITPGVK